MFDASDPRTALDSGRPAAETTTTGGLAAPQVFHLTELVPDRVTAAGSDIWLIRIANCILLVARADAKETFELGELTDESILLAPDDMHIEITAGQHEASLDAASVAGIPSGPVRVRARSSGIITLVLSDREEQWLQLARNSPYYVNRPHAVSPVPADSPAAAFPGIQIYGLSQIAPSPGRFGRIFRSRTLMVNALYDEDGPRDPDRLSPHVHADFEQCSVTFHGSYVHHMRAPWTSRLADWRDDVHIQCESPSVTVIPPGWIHTTQGVGAGLHKMADVFSPPRADFLAQPGWVLNGENYPGEP